jgi:hypothetical protein
MKIKKILKKYNLGEYKLGKTQTYMRQYNISQFKMTNLTQRMDIPFSIWMSIHGAIIHEFRYTLHERLLTALIICLNKKYCKRVLERLC